MEMRRAMLMRRSLVVLSLAVAASACDTSAKPPITTQSTRAQIETIQPQEWDLLDRDILIPPQRPVGCDTGPAPTRAAVVPAVGSNPTQRRLKVGVPVAVLWQVVGGYSGPILVRGRQLDGPAAVYFANLESPPTDGSSTPIEDGNLLKTVQTSDGTLELYGGVRLAATGGVRSWWTYVYVDSPGCFFWQQNGRDYQGTLTFEAVDSHQS
jgi:hypothetical protein